MLEQVLKEVEAGNVDRRDLGNLSIFKYGRGCTYDFKWNDINMRCRGIVFDMLTGNIVARPFDKFFNIGEHPSVSADIIREKKQPFIATSKLDGTMVSIFHYNGLWHTATPGSLESDQAKWALDYLKHYDLNSWPKDQTYVCEMIAGWDRKVISYDFEGLVLLSAFKNTWEQIEIGRNELAQYSIESKMPLVAEYNINDIIGHQIPNGEEGYVICYNDGLRVKIKGEWYTTSHKFLDNISISNVVSIVKGDSAVSLDNIPLHILAIFDDLRILINLKFLQINEQVEKWWPHIPNATNQDFKESALYIKANVPKELHSIMFAKMRGKEYSHIIWDLVEESLKESRSKNEQA